LARPPRHRALARRCSNGPGRRCRVRGESAGYRLSDPRSRCEGGAAVGAARNGPVPSSGRTRTYCGGLRLARYFVEFIHEDSFAATFTTWTRTWRIPMSGTVNSAFEMTGTVREVGRLGMEW